MRLLSLEVTNYRNIASARLEPGRELTVICGNNGQGKTNLLEAIWLLTGGKSFRGGKDAELVRRGETFAVLEAVTQRTRQEDQEPDDPARVRITVGTPDGSAIIKNIYSAEYGQSIAAAIQDRFAFILAKACRTSPEKYSVPIIRPK